MGRPKIKVIDDSQAEPEENKQNTSKKAPKLESVNSSVIPREARNLKINESGDPSLVAQDDNNKDKIATDSSAPRNDKSTKPQKPGKAKPRSKKYQEIAKDLDKNKAYPLNEAVELVKKLSITKFPATLEAHINTAQTGIRGLVSLPFASGRKLRILAFGKNAENLSSVILNEAKRSEESLANARPKPIRQAQGPEFIEGQVERSFANAQDDNNIIIGSEDTIEEINKGKVNFDIVITTPEWMPKLAKVARILGPRGLMPNPKNGTIVSGEDGLKKAVEGFQAGKTEYKTEGKAPVMHIALGKLNQPNEELIANIKALLQTLGKSRVKKVSLAPTMGPSVKIDLSSL